MTQALWRQMVQRTGVLAVLCGKPRQARLLNLCPLAEWVGSLQELTFQANAPDSSTTTDQKNLQYLCHFVTAPEISGRLVIQVNWKIKLLVI
jgi:hypothetical protein